MAKKWALNQIAGQCYGRRAILRIVCCTVYSPGGITTDFSDFYVLFGEMGGGGHFYKLWQIVELSKRLSA